MTQKYPVGCFALQQHVYYYQKFCTVEELTRAIRAAEWQKFLQ